jgi:NAD(P)-dependent dehydrogenase (short-subunit alcohol dehydrogenase family)
MRSDRTAVITGGAVGFGRAFARALIAEGVSVVLADIDVDTAERTADRRSRSNAMSPTPTGWMSRSRRPWTGSAASTS